MNGYKWGQWSLPTFGALVGFGTNWIALKMIFEPTFPVKVDRLSSPFGTAREGIPCACCAASATTSGSPCRVVP